MSARRNAPRRQHSIRAALLAGGASEEAHVGQVVGASKLDPHDVCDGCRGQRGEMRKRGPSANSHVGIDAGGTGMEVVCQPIPAGFAGVQVKQTTRDMVRR